MTSKEISEAFTEKFNNMELDAAAEFLSDDFQFSGPAPEPISGPQWIGLLKSMRAAFPDFAMNLRVTEVDGDVIISSNQLSGTHKADFDLTPMGMGVIPPTGKSFSNPVEFSKATVKDGKIVSVHVDAKEDGGLMGVLRQIGVQPPQ